MKILVNAISARLGGIVTYTSNLIDATAERGVDATFAVSRSFPAAASGNILKLAASEYAALARLVWEQTVWRQIVSSRNPDILFSSANFALMRSPVQQVLLLREGGLFDPLYLTNVAPTQGVYGALLRNLRRQLMLISANQADRIITPTATMRDMLLSWAPHLERKMSVNPYGTLIDAFLPAARPRSWRQDGELKLLYVSVYYPHKNPGTLCRAAEILNKSQFKTSATITMTLDEVARPRGSALDHMLMERTTAAGFINAGHYDYVKLPELYQNHDVFVFPSISETFGHPMVEAMSCGLPVLAADTAVNREICGDAALYFEPFSAGGLIEGLRRLDQDPGLRHDLGIRGRKRILSLFTWDGHVDRLMQIFDDTLRVAPGSRGSR